jgi:hypothetical protein
MICKAFVSLQTASDRGTDPTPAYGPNDEPAEGRRRLRERVDLAADVYPRLIDADDEVARATQEEKSGGLLIESCSVVLPGA